MDQSLLYVSDHQNLPLMHKESKKYVKKKISRLIHDRHIIADRISRVKRIFHRHINRSRRSALRPFEVLQIFEKHLQIIFNFLDRNTGIGLHSRFLLVFFLYLINIARNIFHVL